jgi:hypothetical protein
MRKKMPQMAMLLWKKIKMIIKGTGVGLTVVRCTSSMHSSKQRYRKNTPNPMLKPSAHFWMKKNSECWKIGTELRRTFFTESFIKCDQRRKKRLSRVYRRNGKWNLQNSPPSLKGIFN